MDGLSFDPTINVGSILQIVILLGGLFSIVKKLGEIETKVEAMWQVFIKTVRDSGR
jgi:uncharacterized ion transporter superfamily protein YfcC